MRTRQKRWMIVIAAALASIAWAAWPFLTTTAFLLDLAGSRTGVARLLPAGRSDVVTETLSIPTRHGPVDARLFAPSRLSPRTVVVFPGVHGGGLEEPRLDRFSRLLAATGINVLTVPLPDLRMFRITGRSTDVIEDVTVWTAKNARLASRQRVGLIGASFAGGLALVAAGRPSLAGHLDGVLSLGGHGDLARVLRYLCTGVMPDGTKRTPHDYGLAIVALAAAPKLASGDEVKKLEGAIRMYLDASVDETAEQQKAKALLSQARREGSEMSEPSRSIMKWISDHDVAALGKALEPFIDDLAADPRLSPERSPVTSAPVFLLQGTEDNVIPSSETPRVVAYLHEQGNTNVRALLTPVVSHMTLDSSVGLMEKSRLVWFWKKVRGQILN